MLRLLTCEGILYWSRDWSASLESCSVGRAKFGLDTNYLCKIEFGEEGQTLANKFIIRPHEEPLPILSKLTLHSGFKVFTAQDTPAMSPAPPTGTITASTSGTSSII